MNCLLMRELSLDLILRVWDTYLAEYGGSEDEANEIGDGFAANTSFLATHPTLTQTLLLTRPQSACTSASLS